MIKVLVLLYLFPFFSTDTDPKEIIRKADLLVRGESSYGEMQMTIVRPKWQRDISFKSWSKGDEYAVILVTSPSRDKGTAFLKRDQEIWNWQPSIDRTIKLPPSMMLQSWMGSDFTNDDLVKHSSVVDDFDHKLLGKETVEGRECWIIEMIPKEDAAVVWGKIISWISIDGHLQLKAEFYDEEEYLIHTMYGKEIKEIGGKNLPTLLEIIPEDSDGDKTIVRYKTLEFDNPINEDFFTVKNLKRL